MSSSKCGNHANTRPCVTSLLLWEYLQPAFGCSVQTGVSSNKANRVRVPNLYAANTSVKQSRVYNCSSSVVVLRSGGLKVRLAQVDCVGEFKGKGSGRVFGNDQR